MDSSKSSGRIDMLHGKLLGKIIAFALPLIASGILQQSFNAVDVAVVGRYCNSHALAAVGSNGVIINIMVNLFIGISVGANVVIANYIGHRNNKGIKRSVNTAAFIAIASGLLLTVVGLLFARPILEMMNTPPEVIELAALYLRIYFLGMPFMMIYNFGAAIMRGMGDTRRPFYSLVIAGIINTILNLVLVIGCGMSVDGVAIATVVSNIVNAAIIVWYLSRESEPFKLDIKSIGIERTELKKMLQIGVPAGIQGMVFSLANIFIQSTINTFGSDAIAGSAAALNYESYCYYVISAFSQATVAFVSQNYGAGEHKRCQRIFQLCMALSIASSALLNVLITWQHQFCISVFTTSPDVAAYGAIRIEYVLLFQWIASSYEISGASLRGMGYSMTPTIITIFGTCVLRLLWVYSVSTFNHDFITLLIIYPISWLVTGAAMLITYRIISRRVFSTGLHSA